MREKEIRERLAAIEKRLDELAEAVLELAKSDLELAKSDLELGKSDLESATAQVKNLEYYQDDLRYFAAKEEEGDEFVDRLAKQQAMTQATVDKAQAVVKALEPNRKKMEEDLAKLTLRQRQVYELLRQAKQNKEIAVRLGISVSTAHMHVTEIKRRLGIKDRADFIPPPVNLS